MTTTKNAKVAMLTNCKAGDTKASEVDRLILAALEMGQAGKRATDKDLPMKHLVNANVTYSRAWQIVTMALLEHFQPELIVPEAVKASKDQLGQAIVAMRDQQANSWGLIGCRAGLPEGAIRKMYKLNSGKLDRGQRIGHGGRFLADDATLYDAAERHTAGVVIKSAAELDRAMGKIRDAAHAEDAETFGQYVINSRLAPVAPVKPKRVRKAKTTKEEVAA